jgi:uncharacterized protein YbjQ (UPF0145 family)
MILTTTHSVPGRDISEVLGIARGSTVRTRNAGPFFSVQTPFRNEHFKF